MLRVLRLRAPLVKTLWFGRLCCRHRLSVGPLWDRRCGVCRTRPITNRGNVLNRLLASAIVALKNALKTRSSVLMGRVGLPLTLDWRFVLNLMVILNFRRTVFKCICPLSVLVVNSV